MTQNEAHAAIEQVAQAICGAANLDWERLEPVYRKLYIRQAEAAIAAMPASLLRQQAVVRIDVDAVHRKVRVAQ